MSIYNCSYEGSAVQVFAVSAQEASALASGHFGCRVFDVCTSERSVVDNKMPWLDHGFVECQGGIHSFGGGGVISGPFTELRMCGVSKNP